MWMYKLDYLEITVPTPLSIITIPLPRLSPPLLNELLKDTVCCTTPLTRDKQHTAGATQEGTECYCTNCARLILAKITILYSGKKRTDHLAEIGILVVCRVGVRPENRTMWQAWIEEILDCRDSCSTQSITSNAEVHADGLEHWVTLNYTCSPLSMEDF